MSLSVTAQQPIASRHHVPVSSTRGLQHLQIDSVPSSPSLYSDDGHDENPRPTLKMIAQPTTEQAPALPEKSARRASRMMLDNIITHKLTTEDQQPPLSTQAAPHAVYLSSEEDASSSADDFSDFECEYISEAVQQPTGRRGSQKDTARVVSVIYSGKPCIVDLPRRSMSPTSSESSSRPPSRLRRTSILPVIDRRVSVGSAPSDCSMTSGSSAIHPPRTSSMLPPSRLEKQKPQFLSIDPFATKRDQNDDQIPGINDMKTPKTPSGMFKRTLSLVKKRSRPSLNTHFSASRDNLSTIISPNHMEQVREESQAPVSENTPALNARPVTYHEIVMSAKRRAQTAPMSPISPMSEPPASPMTPNGSRSRLRFSSARRRSIRT